MHLKRFEIGTSRILYNCSHRTDYYSDNLGYVKVNDFQSFPTVLELDHLFHPDAEQSAKPVSLPLSPSPSVSWSQRYHLHGVLVHSGSVNSGHYYAFLRTTLEVLPSLCLPCFLLSSGTVVSFRRWHCDESFWKESSRRQLWWWHCGYLYRSLFFAIPFWSIQGRGAIQRRLKSNSAYMLVYLREDARKELLTDVLLDEIPTHTRERFQKIVDDEKRARIGIASSFEIMSVSVVLIFAEREESQLYLHCAIVTEKDFARHAGSDLVDIQKVKTFKVLRSRSLSLSSFLLFLTSLLSGLFLTLFRAKFVNI